MEEKEFGKKGLMIMVILIVFLLIIIGFNVMRANRARVQFVAAPEVIPVKTDTAKKSKIDQILELTGNIEAKQEVDVFYKIPGKIIENIYVDNGDPIQAGDKIAELETASILAKMDQAKAALDLARANLKQAETNLNVLVKDKKRLENLYRQKAVSEQKLDHMSAQVQTAVETKKLAQARIKQAEATLKELNIAYEDHTLLAPITGYVSKRYVDKGAMSAPGQPVVRISNEDVLKIVTAVTEKEFVHIKKGMPVEISVDAFPDSVIQGTVSVISPTINPMTRTGEIEIHINNADHRIQAGMFARINLYLGKRESTTINRDGLLKIPGTGSYFVYIVEDGQAIQKNIKTGIEQGSMVEVVSGINPGDRVVITGQNRVKEGISVSVVE